MAKHVFVSWHTLPRLGRSVGAHHVRGWWEGEKHFLLSLELFLQLEEHSLLFLRHSKKQSLFILTEDDPHLERFDYAPSLGSDDAVGPLCRRTFERLVGPVPAALRQLPWRDDVDRLLVRIIVLYSWRDE